MLKVNDQEDNVQLVVFQIVVFGLLDLKFDIIFLIISLISIDRFLKNIFRSSIKALFYNSVLQIFEFKKTEKQFDHTVKECVRIKMTIHIS